MKKCNIERFSIDQGGITTSKTQEILNLALEHSRKVLTVKESKSILKTEGFPVNLTGFGRNLEEIIAEGEKIGFPVVMKVSSEDIVHKSDIGGVITDIRSVEELKTQYEIMRTKIERTYPEANVEGFIIEKMESGIELLVGSTHDPMFGPILAFGL
ncbi:MAG: acetate--CoA ligase family protein, partial [Candidatus Hodarchaeales archaeon]